MAIKQTTMLGSTTAENWYIAFGRAFEEQISSQFEATCFWCSGKVYVPSKISGIFEWSTGELNLTALKHLVQKLRVKETEPPKWRRFYDSLTHTIQYDFSPPYLCVKTYFNEQRKTGVHLNLNISWFIYEIIN